MQVGITNQITDVTDWLKYIPLIKQFDGES